MTEWWSRWILYQTAPMRKAQDSRTGPAAHECQPGKNRTLRTQRLQVASYCSTYLVLEFKGLLYPDSGLCSRAMMILGEPLGKGEEKQMGLDDECSVDCSEPPLWRVCSPSTSGYAMPRSKISTCCHMCRHMSLLPPHMTLLPYGLHCSLTDRDQNLCTQRS